MIHKKRSGNRIVPHILTVVLLGSFLSPIAFTKSVLANGYKSEISSNTPLSGLAQIKGPQGPGTNDSGEGLGPRSDPAVASPNLKGNTFPSIPGVHQVFDRNSGQVSGLNKGSQPGSSRLKAAEYLAKRPLSFIENRGQTHPSVRFEVRAGTHTVFFTPQETVFATFPENDGKRTGEALRIKFPGASPNPTVSGLDRLSANYNFFTGNDPANWKTDVPTYSSIAYKNLYKGVDLIYRDSKGKIERDFVIAPGVSPSVISMKYEGAKKVRIGGEGNLVVETDLSVLTESKPIAYQEIRGERIEVTANFKLARDGSVGFEVGSYDEGEPLVIDPIFGFSTFVGGNNDDEAFGLAVDASGVYVTGYTVSVNFPVTNTFGTRAGIDTFAFKLSPNGSTLIYSAILAGNGTDIGLSTQVRPGDQTLYVLGFTQSANFPTTVGAFDTTFNGGVADYTVTRLNAAGNGLVWSTYIGGSGQEVALGGIDVYINGDCWIVGGTDSGGATYPVATTFGTNLSPANAGGFDGVATAINAAGTIVITSGFWGGLSTDQGAFVKINQGTLDFHYTGFTFSSNAPVCTGVGAPFAACLAAGFDTTYNGGRDGHVTRFTNVGTPRGSTFLGTPASTANDEPWSIDIDNANNIYVGGNTTGPTYPTTPGAFDTTFNGGTSDQVVTKFNSTLSLLGYSTFIGGSGDDAGRGIAVTGTGEANLAGFTNSLDYPAPPSSFSGAADATVARFSASGSALTFASYIGGASTDAALGIRLNSASVVTIAGFTGSPNFPTTPGAFDTTFNGVFDVFVSQVSTTFTNCLRQDGDPTVLFFNALTGQYQLCAPLGITLTGTGTVSISGCSLTVSDANTFIQINLCSRTGFASVFVPGKAFVITVDQNIDDNVCVCLP